LRPVLVWSVGACRHTPDIVSRIQQEWQVAEHAGHQEKLLALGAHPAATHAQFTDFINAEHKKWAQVVKNSGAKVD
jgi:hypothetical protein